MKWPLLAFMNPSITPGATQLHVITQPRSASAASRLCDPGKSSNCSVSQILHL